MIFKYPVQNPGIFEVFSAGLIMDSENDLPTNEPGRNNTHPMFFKYMVVGINHGDPTMVVHCWRFLEPMLAIQKVQNWHHWHHWPYLTHFDLYCQET